MKSNKIVWLQRGWQPCYIGFCPSEAAWKNYLKGSKLGINPPYPVTSGCMTVFENTEKQLCLIVTINSSLDKTYKKDPSFVTSTLVHESIHVWQLILERIKEVSKPSHEIEAYSIQNIYQQLFQAYLDTRINKKK